MRQTFEEAAALSVQSFSMREGPYKRCKFFSPTGQYLLARSASDLPELQVGGTVELEVPGKPNTWWRIKGLTATTYGSQVIIEPMRDISASG